MIKKVFILLVMGCLSVSPVFASETTKTLIQVNGSSQKEVAPDAARIIVTINSVNANLETAKKENTQIVNQVFAKLNDQGVSNEQIKTNTYLVEPIYLDEKGRLPKLEGYRVINSLEIRTSVEKVGSIVNDLTNAGANEINSIRFETMKESEIKNEALTDAVADAMKKAEVIAAALNKKIAYVTLLSESGVYYHPVMLESRQLKAAVRDVSVPDFYTGRVTIGATVQVTVALE